MKVAVPSSTKGMKKAVKEMLQREGWDQKWEELVVETRSSLKVGKASKVSK